jgi:glucose-6-phosphate isomerase, archaeal
MSSPRPCAVQIDFPSGVVAGYTARYQKRLSELRGLFRDAEALEKRIEAENDPICYENFAFNQNVAEGDLFFGTTVIYPGKVGTEYHMTRGHQHQIPNRAETYQALSGRGLVLFELPGQKELSSAPLSPGAITYIPPYWLHRSVNTGDEPLVFLWTCSTDAGHNYSAIPKYGFSQIAVEHDGQPRIEPNPAARC